MSLIKGSYPIAKFSGRCAQTDRALEPGEAFIAALAESLETGELRRIDYSIQAWSDGARPESPWRVFASWRGVAPSPDRPKRPMLDTGSALDLFEQLVEDEDVQDETPASPRHALRYVLTLLLVRKRALVYHGTRDGTILVARKGEDEAPPIEITDPGLDESTIAIVAEQLDAVLEGES